MLLFDSWLSWNLTRVYPVKGVAYNTRSSTQKTALQSKGVHFTGSMQALSFGRPLVPAEGTLSLLPSQSGLHVSKVPVVKRYCESYGGNRQQSQTPQSCPRTPDPYALELDALAKVEQGQRCVSDRRRTGLDESFGNSECRGILLQVARED